MHFPTTVLLALPLLASADQQPLLDKAYAWFDIAKSYLPTALAPNVVDAGASYVAAHNTEKITEKNWQRKLTPKPEGPEEWLILVTGGNKTCYGKCGHVDQVWNQSIPLLLATSDCPRLATLNCEAEDRLCIAWAASVPSLWHFSVPQAQTPQPPSPLHITYLNHTTVTPQEILKIHTNKEYLEKEEYTGMLHPIDGALVKYQLLMPYGYVLWVFSVVPSWAFMIGISFFSRQVMAKRVARAPAPAAAGVQAQGGAKPASGGTPARGAGRPKKA